MNTSAKCLPRVLGTLPGTQISPAVLSLSNLLDANQRARKPFLSCKKEMLLQFKFEDILDLLDVLTTPGAIG
ncbi:hypothetical protein [Peribacillus sp. NJ4]|uniref:hypothetical protein n=1 Tax=Peribacillus sp. NJ4 TaxID=3055862 RepID=UPI0025A030B8|nr:hypothetical protein [Peribacillus sp. NJ4]